MSSIYLCTSNFELYCSAIISMKNTSKSHLLFIFTTLYRVSAADDFTYVQLDNILLDCGTETEVTDETMWETIFGSAYAASELKHVNIT